MGSKTVTEHWCDSCGSKAIPSKLLKFIGVANNSDVCFNDIDICFSCLNDMVKNVIIPKDLWEFRYNCSYCKGKGVLPVVGGYRQTSFDDEPCEYCGKPKQE